MPALIASSFHFFMPVTLRAAAELEAELYSKGMIIRIMHEGRFMRNVKRIQVDLRAVKYDDNVVRSSLSSHTVDYGRFRNSLSKGIHS
jgi:hypothetical protein